MADNQPRIHLWKSLDGVRCELTRSTDGPPFEVVFLMPSGVEHRHTFDHHNDAAAFAIQEMEAAFSPFIVHPKA